MAPPVHPKADVHGKVLRVEGVASTTDRQELKTVCSAHGDVAFVDFKYGDTTGYVRFRKPAAAKAAFAALSASPPDIAGATPSWKLLSNEEADAYWEAVQQHKGDASGGGEHSRKEHHGSGEHEREHGVVLAFDGVGAQADREALHAVCSRFGDVAFVDFNRGDTSGYVRFRKHDAAAAALHSCSAQAPDVGGAPPTWTLLSEEEEEKYKAVVQERLDARKRRREEAQEQGGTSGAAEPERGVVLSFNGAGAEADREALYALCGGFGEVAFVDFNRGDSSGYVRFRKHDAAAAAIDSLRSEPQDVGGAAPSWELLSDEAEGKYKEGVQERKRQRGGKGARGGRGFRGRSGPRGWGGRGRR